MAEAEPQPAPGWVAGVLRRLATIRNLSALAAVAGIAGGTAGVARYVESRSPVELVGRYRVDNQIETTTLQRYQGLQLGYIVAFTQAGRSIRGRGEKAWEGGEELSGAARTPVSLDCNVVADSIDCVVEEEGARRTTTGTYRWALRGGPPYRGSFTSTAASSAGPSTLSPLEQ